MFPATPFRAASPVALVAAVFLAAPAFSQSTTITFDTLVSGQTSFGFDGDGDGTPDAVFSTDDPLGFNTIGPGLNQRFIQEPGLEGSSLDSVDLRVDFARGATDYISFGFALNSFQSSTDSRANVELYDSGNRAIGFTSVDARIFSTGGGNTSIFPEGELFLSFPGEATSLAVDFQSDSGRYIIDDFEGTFGTADRKVFDPRLLLASVAEASEGAPSTGTALGRLVESRFEGYTNGREAAFKCATEGIPPGCDPGELNRDAEMAYAQDASDLGRVGVGVVTETSGVAVGATAVDSTAQAAFEATKVGQAVGFAGLIGKLKSFLENGADFLRAVRGDDDEEEPPVESLSVRSAAIPAALLSLDSEPSPFLLGTQLMETSLDEEEIAILSLAGDLLYDNDDRTSWSLFDLVVDAHLPEGDFAAFREGDLFAALGPIVPEGQGFGIFTVLDLDEETSTARLSLQHIDHYAEGLSPAPIPLPAGFPLMAGALGLLAAMRARSRRS